MTDVATSADIAHKSPLGDVWKGLPRRIKVGQFTFRVTIALQGNCELLDGNDGRAVWEDYRLYFREDMPIQAAVNTVYHEVTHAINWIYGVTDESTEEQFTTQHTNGQIGVFLDNPRLLNWLIKGLRRIKKEGSSD